jgi:hypothetical protein
VTSQLPVALSRNASLAIDGDGRPAKAKGSKLKGSRDASSGLSLVSNGRVSDFCSALYSRNQGWGRVSQAGRDVWIRRSEAPGAEAHTGSVLFW